MFRRIPREARDLALPGERVLAWSTVRGSRDAYALATDVALYMPVPEPIRIPWDQIAKATWGDDGVLVVEGRIDPRGPDRTWQVAIDDPRALPTVVYERVTSTIVVSERVNLDGSQGIRIVGRRAGDGLRWTVTFDAGLNPADPDLRRRADEALADLRSTLGV